MKYLLYNLCTVNPPLEMDRITNLELQEREILILPSPWNHPGSELSPEENSSARGREWRRRLTENVTQG